MKIKITWEDKKRLTLRLVLDFLKNHSKKRFKFDGLVEYVLKNGGTYNLAPSYKIRDYLDRLVVNKVLTYDSYQRDYRFSE